MFDNLRRMGFGRLLPSCVQTRRDQPVSGVLSVKICQLIRLTSLGLRGGRESKMRDDYSIGDT